MDDNARNLQVAQIASMLAKDKISANEQDTQKLAKYVNFAKSKFGLPEDDSINLVNEALFYLKLQSSADIDLLAQADKFGAGFS